LQFKASPCKIVSEILPGKPHYKKRARSGSSSKGTCLASVRPSVETPVPPKENIFYSLWKYETLLYKSI
jgi:hypothetical protein